MAIALPRRTDAVPVSQTEEFGTPGQHVYLAGHGPGQPNSSNPEETQRLQRLIALCRLGQTAGQLVGQFGLRAGHPRDGRCDHRFPRLSTRYTGDSANSRDARFGTIARWTVPPAANGVGTAPSMEPSTSSAGRRTGRTWSVHMRSSTQETNTRCICLSARSARSSRPHRRVPDTGNTRGSLGNSCSTIRTRPSRKPTKSASALEGNSDGRETSPSPPSRAGATDWLRRPVRRCRKCRNEHQVE